MQSIYLIGFMGSGKTTVADQLGKYYQLPVQDTDQMIEAMQNKKIKQIFAEEGEHQFRQYEHDVLTTTESNNCIIATGGGIIEQDRNVHWLKDKQVIYLQTSWPEIVNRLKDEGDRPIWQDQNRDKEQLLLSREQKYLEAATYVIRTDGKSIDLLVKEIIEVITTS
ncbi:shikimate kinase [Natronobacillus azotifigens]|uniref:Shikimate kinase n=1 Tax=Natronobacillus azotifigens TaxID=472978 RepID=A0A9J6RET8_9BACI|nr:shikimate kinase [Natronobacillus azotifigens]MCZ0704071.1 shikimate kinase [Natronobacillus azotifigens]